MGVECVVHAVVQRGQCRRPGELRLRLRRHRPHRGVRRSLGELRRRRLPGERSPAPAQAARRVRAGRALASSAPRSNVHSGRPISAIGVGNPSTVSVPQLLHLHEQLHRRGQRYYELRPRAVRKVALHGSSTWALNVSYQVLVLGGRPELKLSVYNLLNRIDESRWTRSSRGRSPAHRNELPARHGLSVAALRAADLEADF